MLRVWDTANSALHDVKVGRGASAFALSCLIPLLLAGCAFEEPQSSAEEIAQAKLADEYATVRKDIEEQCQNSPLAQEVLNLRHSAWYWPGEGFTDDDIHLADESLQGACNALGQPSADIAQSDLRSMRDLLKDVTAARNELQSLRDDAFTFADYSYAYLQATYAHSAGVWNMKGDVSDTGSALHPLQQYLETLEQAPHTPDDTDLAIERTKKLRELIAAEQAVITKNADIDGISRLLAGFEPLSPDPANDNDALFPAFVRDEIPSVSQEIDKIYKFPPVHVGNLRFQNKTAVPESGYYMFDYASEAGETGEFLYRDNRSVRDQATFAEALGYQSIDDVTPRYSGIGNEVCTSMRDGSSHSAEVKCWAYTKEGQLWIFLPGNLSNAASTGALTAWMRNLD